jgi:hypothetical protein
MWERVYHKNEKAPRRSGAPVVGCCNQRVVVDCVVVPADPPIVEVPVVPDVVVAVVSVVMVPDVSVDVASVPDVSVIVPDPMSVVIPVSVDIVADVSVTPASTLVFSSLLQANPKTVSAATIRITAAFFIVSPL